jgi:hypothetical protein
MRLLSERKGFANFASAESAVDDFVEEPKKIGEIDPKSAVETTGIESTIHERIVPLNHHEPFAFEAIHQAVIP